MAGAEDSHYHRSGYDEGQGTDYFTGAAKDPALRSEKEWATHNSLVSYFGRFNYNLLDRYLLTATFRADKLADKHVENDWYAIDFNPSKGTIKQLYDKELGKNLLSEQPEWEMGEFIYEIIDSRHPMELYKAPQFLRRRPEKMRFERYEQGAI